MRLKKRRQRISSNSSGRVISENTVLKIIETIGYKGKMTGHGFRSLARTLLGDMGHQWEVLEAMLSHALVKPDGSGLRAHLIF